jgi:hypothetical protein
MRDLIEALQIFAKYIPDKEFPTLCEHDELWIDCDPEWVSEEDCLRLNQLGFSTCLDDRKFYSFRYGSY